MPPHSQSRMGKNALRRSIGVSSLVAANIVWASSVLLGVLYVVAQTCTIPPRLTSAFFFTQLILYIPVLIITFYEFEMMREPSLKSALTGAKPYTMVVIASLAVFAVIRYLAHGAAAHNTAILGMTPLETRMIEAITTASGMIMLALALIDALILYMKNIQ